MSLIGQVLPEKFLIVSRIASGAVANIYLATDGRERRAVKHFPERHRARAEREHACGAGLAHPNLNPTLALEPLAGGVAVIMPYVVGQRLDAALAGLTRPAFLRALRDVFAALAALHAQGVVHRDVKPENVVLRPTAGATPFSEVSFDAVLFDFDLSVRLGERVPERAAGTLPYLSPEQARGEPAAPQADLYSAGVLLYRGLTGEVPFTGSMSEVLAAHQSALPPSPSSFDPALSPLDDLTLRLLAKRPEDRPQSAAAVLAALEPHLA